MKNCKCYNTIKDMGHDPICDCECHQLKEEYALDADKVLEGEMKLSEFRKKYNIGDPTF